MERIVTWPEIKKRVSKFDNKLKYYGVPRGGQYIAALLNPVDTPEEADVIIDDIIDSGRTMTKYRELYPDKPFWAPFKNESHWIRFPWEQKGEVDIEHHVARVIEYFDDINREGLKNTPKRYIQYLKEFLHSESFKFTTFDSEGMDQMIVQKDIPFYSLCEHHLVPFYGVGHIAYIPNGKIVGLSKLARTLEHYSRRFQNQERITQQVADRLNEELHPKGVGVVIRARHLCMEMRGVKKHDTWTVTSAMSGIFRDLDARTEFLNFISHV